MKPNPLTFVGCLAFSAMFGISSSNSLANSASEGSKQYLLAQVSSPGESGSEDPRKLMASQLEEAAVREKAGDYPAAILIYKSLLEKYPDHYEAKFRLARMYRFNQEPQNALDVYNELLKAHPENTDVLAGRGYTYFQLGNFGAALASFRESLKLNANQPDVQKMVKRVEGIHDQTALQSELKSLEEDCRWEEAEALYRKALKDNPGNADLRYGLGRNLVRQDRLTEAEAEFTRLIETHPENPDYRIGRGLTLRLQNRMDEAWADYHHVHEQFPENTDALVGKGSVAYRRRDFTDSNRFYRQAQAIDPDNEDVRWALWNVDKFVMDQVIVETVVETFSTRTSRENYHLEWIHPVNDRLRTMVGGDLVRNLGDTDTSGFFGINYDWSLKTNIGLKAAFTPDAFTLPRTMFEVELQQAVDPYPVSFLLTYRFMNFRAVDFHLLSPGVAYYLNDRTTITARAYLGFQSAGTSASGYLKVDYRITPEVSVYVGGVIGNEAFRVETVDVTRRVTTRSFITGLQWRASDLLFFRLVYEYEDRKDQFIRNVFGGSVSFRF